MSKISEIKQQIRKLENKLAIEENKEKECNIDCPFRYGDIYYWICRDGEILESDWKDTPSEFDSFIFGNVFETEEGARFERDKRLLLIQFKNYRDKCNGDWKPNWEDSLEYQFFIVFDYNLDKLVLTWYTHLKHFNNLGYFKNDADVERAIELFGDEIKRLYVEE